MTTAMSTVIHTPDDLIQMVSARLGDLPDAQRRAALYLINHYARIPFMTATDFAQAAGTSQSSVTRFIISLGFPSYGMFTEMLGRIVLGELNETLPVVRFARSSSGANLSDLIEAEVRHMLSLQQLLRSDAFTRSVDHLDQARRVIVAGFGAGASIAVHAHLYLSRIRPDVTLTTDLTAPVITQLAHYDGHDRALIFAVPRYMKDALTLLEVLKERGVPTILVADRTVTDLAPLATELMIVPITNGPTTALPVAMFTLSSLLIESVALHHPDQTMPRLTAFEDMASRSELFARSQARTRDSWEAQLQDFTASPQVPTDG
ncbi:MurR/RpiR family transcriptional regulator [Deinococcus sp.]|uniref:MurR/RpiR family transcriptional regulator n=1 Tax=Deinococcus sp. TaxID=47478 RepID=UPI002869EABC|nr:MurR/RpiR family transcriptional regulator [Deinococcus sp.]